MQTDALKSARLMAEALGLMGTHLESLMSMAEQSTNPTSILELLRRLEERGNLLVKKPDSKGGDLHVWVHEVRARLGKIYGKDSQELVEFPVVPPNFPKAEVHATLTHRLEQLKRIIEGLEALVRNSVAPLRGRRVFIGHGRSPLWRELKDFITDQLRLPWDEFNREAVAGYTTSERLENMLAQAAFAFLILTAEEEHRDTNLYARPNVIHEVGLFQGRLGLRRAIVMLEDGCSEFSNITGLSQIRFPRGDISARFEEVRRVLAREGLVET